VIIVTEPPAHLRRSWNYEIIVGTFVIALPCRFRMIVKSDYGVRLQPSTASGARANSQTTVTAASRSSVAAFCWAASDGGTSSTDKHYRGCGKKEILLLFNSPQELSLRRLADPAPRM
jgi:hypothetical protein